MSNPSNRAMPSARATGPSDLSPASGSSQSSVPIAVTRLPAEATAAWVEYEPPTINSSNPLVIANGVMRHAFMTGFLAAQRASTCTACTTPDGSCWHYTGSEWRKVAS